MPKEATLNGRDRADRPGRVNNRDRILEASLALFNERGAPAVSTNTIAAYLAISPGNLYYHFANKEQIIRELWSQVKEATLPVIDLPADGSVLSPERWAGYFVAGIETISQFRFFFRDVDELVARDPEFAEAFRSEMQWGGDRLVATLYSLIEHGAMSPPENSGDVERLAANIQLLFSNWIRFTTTALGRVSVSATDIAEGGLHAFVIVERYLDPDYARRARAVLEGRMRQALGADATDVAPTANR